MEASWGFYGCSDRDTGVQGGAWVARDLLWRIFLPSINPTTVHNLVWVLFSSSAKLGYLCLCGVSALNTGVSAKCFARSLSATWLSQAGCDIPSWSVRHALLAVTIGRMWNWSWVLANHGGSWAPQCLRLSSSAGNEKRMWLRRGGNLMSETAFLSWVRKLKSQFLPGRWHGTPWLCTWMCGAVSSHSCMGLASVLNFPGCPETGPSSFQDSVPLSQPNIWFFDLIVWCREVEKSSSLGH